MTKVLMNVDLLDYRQDMKEGLRQVLQYQHIQGVRRPERVYPLQPDLHQQEVLPPPAIELIFADEYNGQDPEEDYIAAQVYHDFGIACMHITICDDRGNLIESGPMEPFPFDLQHWDYLPSVPVPLGTKVIVHVTATDCMGGVTTRSVRRTLGEEDW